MSTITKEFTKEQLIEQTKKNIEVLRGAAERIPCASDAAVIHLKLAEITLASLKAEPVAYADPQAFRNFQAGAARREWMWRNPGEDLIAVYTAPPAPVAVPTFEEWCERTEQKPVGWVRDAMKEAYDGCRDAMLQGAGGNSPDGWVACSERMPDPDSAFRVCAYTPTPHEDVRFRFVPASLFKSVCRDATHWQYMLPPAAPQQEDL